MTPRTVSVERTYCRMMSKIAIQWSLQRKSGRGSDRRMKEASVKPEAEVIALQNEAVNRFPPARGFRPARKPDQARRHREVQE